MKADIATVTSAEPVAEPATTTVAPSPSSTGSTARQVGYAVVGLGHITQVAVMPGFAQAKNARMVALVSGRNIDAARLAEILGGPLTRATPTR